MPDLSPLAASVAALLKERDHTLSLTESSCAVTYFRLPGLGARGLCLFQGRRGVLHTGGPKGFVGSARQRYGRPPRQFRALCPAQRPDSSRKTGNHVGFERNRSQRAYRESLRRLIGPRLLRGCRTRGAVNDPGDRVGGSGSQHVGVRQGRVGPAGAVHSRCRLISRIRRLGLHTSALGPVQDDHA